MIKKYWAFLNYLSAHNLFYFAVLLHLVCCTIAVVVFAVAFPILWSVDKIKAGYTWLKMHFSNGVNELKKGKTN